MMHCFQKPQLQFEPFKPLIHQKYAHVLDATSSKVIQIAIKHGMKESSKGTTVIVLTYREVDQNNAMNFVNDLIDCVQNQLGLRGSAPPIIELKTIKSDSTDADEKMHSFLSQNQLLVLKSLESFNASHYNLLFKYMFTDPPEVPRGFLIYTLKLPNNTSIPSNPNPLDIERLVHSQLLQLWQPILTNNTIYAIFSRLSSNALLASKTNHL